MHMQPSFSDGQIVVNVFDNTGWAFFGVMRLCVLCMDMHAISLDSRLLNSAMARTGSAFQWEAL
jgi:hypothetical protein